MLTINEIFHSIQGESTYAGAPCVFVRLTACDLRCAWCDTVYAFGGGQRLAPDEVVRRVAAYGCSLVEITGGEPLMQDEVYPLMDQLVAGGLTVLLETGGHRSLDRVPAAVIAIVDVKCPASGEADRMCWSNLERVRAADQVKFVIQDRADYEYAREVQRRYLLGERCAAVLYSPVHDALAPKDLAAWILEDRLQARLQIQVHKDIWGKDTRGV